MHTPPPASHAPSLVRTTAVVGLAAMFSRVLGFVRDMAMAWLLGNSLAADALVMAMRLPHVMRRLLGEGALSMSLTADFVHGGHTTGTGSGNTGTPPLPFQPAQHAPASPPCQCPDQGPPLPAQLPSLPLGLARAVGLRLALVLGVALLLGEMLARPLALLLAPGQAQDVHLLDSAVPLLRLCLPYAFTAGMAALGMALLHSMGRFFLPALMPALFNVTILIFAALAAARVVPEAWFPPQASPAAWLLAVGVCCGGLVQWLTQAIALRRCLPSRRQAPDAWAQPPAGAARRCLSRLPGAVLGAAAPQLAMLGGMVVASWLPQGSVAALYYAERLLELPLGVAGAALGVASLPALSRMAADAQHEEFARSASHALRLSLCVTLPAMAGLLAVALPLVQTLFARGAFDHSAVQATVLALAGYAPGLPAYGLTRPLLAACQARRRRRACALSGAVAIAVAVLASAGLTCAALALTLPPAWALLAPPLGVTLGLWVQTVLLFRAAQADLPARLRLDGRSLAQQGMAALCTGLGAWAMTQAPLPPWACLALAVPVGIAVYVLALHCMGNAEFKDMLAARRKACSQGSCRVK